MTTKNKPAGLIALEGTIRRELDLLAFPTPNWVIPRITSGGEEILNVLIVGGGQAGLTVAFGLMRDRVDRIQVLDANESPHKGPWKNFGRMPTLRSPKFLTGPDLNIPSLTYRSWHEAMKGTKSWDELFKIDREDWSDYLVWLREILEIPVEDGAEIGPIEWNAAEDCFMAPVYRNGQEKTVYARKVVLCTGQDGAGEWYLPDIIKDNLPKELYAHTVEPIDFAALKGKRVAVIGSRTSAFDNASTALEAGAAEVHMFYRRDRLPPSNPYVFFEKTGWIEHFVELPDADRWRVNHLINKTGYLIPNETYERAAAFENFYFHPESPLEDVGASDGKAWIKTPKETFHADFLIAATGSRCDLSKRREFEKLYPQILLWRDQYTPPSGMEDEDMGNHPYLSRDMQFIEKKPGAAPYMAGLFNYNAANIMSFSLPGSLVFPMKYYVPRLTRAITRQLFVDDGAKFVEGHRKAISVTAVYADYPEARGGGGASVKKVKPGKELGPG